MPEDGQGTSTLDYTPPSRVRSRFAQASDCFVSMLTFWSPGLSGEICRFCHWLEEVAFPQESLHGTIVMTYMRVLALNVVTMAL